jgi:hypothetical protein
MVDRMKRRSFLASLAALGVAPGLGVRAQAVPATDPVGLVGAGGQVDLKITKVEVLQVTGPDKRKVLYLKVHANGALAGL